MLSTFQEGKKEGKQEKKKGGSKEGWKKKRNLTTYIKTLDSSVKQEIDLVEQFK